MKKGQLETNLETGPSGFPRGRTDRLSPAVARDNNARSDVECKKLLIPAIAFARMELP